jgi:hypothetical protein
MERRQMNTAKRFWTIGAATTLVFAALLLIARPARADSFESFRATGFFNDTPNLPLSGGFIVDETTGQVASVNLFHGPTELNILGMAGASSPDTFSILAFNQLGDALGLLFVAPGNQGSLTGYTGGVVCSITTLDVTMDPACGTDASTFSPHIPAISDDVFIGEITDVGSSPSPIPEPSTLMLVGLGLVALLVAGRRLPS